MDYRIFNEPQNGASYDDQLGLALESERLGFDAYFRSDHYLTMDDRFGGLPGPTDSWVTLAGLARETGSIRLGTLVSSATHRLPALLAIQVAQVDQMSGGRVELGLGTGWFEKEHHALGIPFPAKRFDIFEEQLAIVTGLWATPVGSTFDFGGDYYTLDGAPGLPKPVQDPLPIIIGGRGPKRTPALAAQYAHEHNSWIADELPDRLARVRDACTLIGRDPASIVFSAVGTAAVGPTDDAVARRADAAASTPAHLRALGFGGSAAEVADRISALGEMGVTRVYFQIRDFHDFDQLEYIASEVIPQVG